MTRGWPWPILRRGHIWSHRLSYGRKWKLLFYGNYCSLRSEVAWSIQLNELMKLSEYQRSRSFLDLGQKSLRFQSWNLISIELGDLELKLIWKLKWEWVWRFIQMTWVTWPTWPQCPYMVKTLKHLLQNQWTNDLDTWYVALFMQLLPRLFKLWPWVDLYLFYAKVKFGHIGFCMRKSENYYFFFFRNYCSLRSQSCLKHSAKWAYEVEWVSKVKVILWPWSKVTQISMLKLVFSQKQLGDLEPNVIWKLEGEWEWRFIQMSWDT